MGMTDSVAASFMAQGKALGEYPKIARQEISATFPSASKGLSKRLFAALMELVHNAAHHGSQDAAPVALLAGEDEKGVFAEVTNDTERDTAADVKKRVVWLSSLTDNALDDLEHQVFNDGLGTGNSGIGLIQVASYATKNDFGQRAFTANVVDQDSGLAQLTIRVYVDQH